MRSILESINLFYETNIVSYFNTLMQYPIKIVALLIDLFIVGYLIFMLVKMVKGTRAVVLLKGIAVLVITTALSKFLSLNLLHYILSSVSTYGVMLIIIIFQPELRRTLEQVGSADVRKLFDFDEQDESSVDEIVTAVYRMSDSKIGALIVFEREMDLTEIITTGVNLDSIVSKELVGNIFVPDTPLHDGAVVVRNGRIIAASCILPITKRENLDRELGTRHRAAIGLSEEYDAITIVVSEETGKVSLVIDGKIIRGLKEENLRKELKRRLERKQPQKTIKQIIKKK